MAKPILDAERVRQVFHYDPQTGLFTRIGTSAWKTNVMKPTPVGRTPGRFGYVHLTMDGQIYPAHRIAFVYMTGRQPIEQIDHINGIRHDNRWGNLREVSYSENSQNTAHRKNTHSGLRGVYPASGKWIARICLNKQRQYLGIYDTPEEAHAAYLKTRAQLFPKQPVPREYLGLYSPPPLPPYVMGQRHTPIIKVGQRWKSGAGKKFRTFVVVEVQELRVRMRSEKSGTTRWCSLSRFNELAGGYSFVQKPAHELEYESWIATLREALHPSPSTL